MTTSTHKKVTEVRTESMRRHKDILPRIPEEEYFLPEGDPRKYRRPTEDEIRARDRFRSAVRRDVIGAMSTGTIYETAIKMYKNHIKDEGTSNVVMLRTTWEAM